MHFFHLFHFLPCLKRYRVELETVQKKTARVTDLCGRRLTEWLRIIFFRLEDLCVDHVMQVYVMWVRDTGDAFPLLVFPLSLISTPESSLKTNIRELKIDFFWWGVRWSFLCTFCSHLVSRQRCSQELADNDFKLYDLAFSYLPERILDPLESICISHELHLFT